MKSCTRSVISAGAVLLLLTLPACSTVTTGIGQQAAPLEKRSAAALEPVQTVNGVAITRAEIDRAMRALLPQNQLTQPLAPGALKQVAQAALDQLTSAELLYQEGAKLEIKDLEQQVAQQIARSRAKYPSAAAFEQALKVTGLTLEEMTRSARKNIVINQFVEQRFAAQATVAEGEAERFFQENRQKYFTRGEGVRASHILIKTDQKTSAPLKLQAQEKASALLKRIQGGEDFAALAKAESSCPSAAQGGDLGSFGHGQMVPPFEKAAFALQPGEISEVVKTQFGYHIIKLTERHDAAAQSFEEVKEKIVEFLKKEKVKQLVAVYLEELRSKAKIERV
jgi:peptidyl-prolyl cis-trans isomerase C